MSDSGQQSISNGIEIEMPTCMLDDDVSLPGHSPSPTPTAASSNAVTDISSSSTTNGTDEPT